MERTRISAAQFFIAMFVSRTVVTITINARFMGGESLLDNIISYLLAMAAGLLIALPIWLSVRSGQGKSVPALAVQRLGPVGKVVPLLYGLYFIVTGGLSLALFQIFLMDAVNPGFSAGLVILALVAVALYGALRGIETVARCAICVFAALLLACGLVFAIVATRFNPHYLEPLFQYGFSQTGQGMLVFLARASVFADMAVLLPQVSGKRKLGFFWWMAGTAAFVGLTILLTAGCLGRYAYTQNFPVYVLASLTEVQSLQRLDAVFTGVWMMGLVIKLACDLYACRVCFWSITGKKEPRWAVWITAAGILALAWAVGEGSLFQGALMDAGWMTVCTVTVGAVLPWIVWIAGLIKKRGKGKANP